MDKQELLYFLYYDAYIPILFSVLRIVIGILLIPNKINLQSITKKMIYILWNCLWRSHRLYNKNELAFCEL